MFLAYRNLCRAHLQEVGLTQILADHVTGTDLWMRSKGPYNYMVMACGLCVKWP